MTTYITSIQQVSITIGASSTSNTATIASVDTSKSWVVLQGYYSSDAGNPDDVTRARVELTDATTVTAYRGAQDGGNTVTVKAVVVEGTASLIGTVQQGTITIASASSNTATISSVTTSRSAVFWLGDITDNAGRAFTTDAAAVTLTNSTTVTANIGATNTGNNLTVGYVVVEFASGVINSLQQVSDAYTTTNTTDTKTISSVTMANTFIAHGGTIASGNNGYAPNSYTLRLTSSTNVDLVRGDNNSGSRTPYYTVIEFVSGVLNSVQRGTIALAAVSSNTATVTSVNSSSFVNFTGYDFAGIFGSNSDEVFSAVTKTNSTTLTANRGAAGSLTSDVGYEVVEFTVPAAAATTGYTVTYAMTGGFGFPNGGFQTYLTKYTYVYILMEDGSRLLMEDGSYMQMD